MHEFATQSLIRLLCVGGLLLGLSGVAQAKEVKNEDLSAEHGALGTQIGDVPTNAEMTTQHDMIKQDIDDAQTAIQTDIAEVKALVEALDGDGAPPCGAGTEGERFVLDDPTTPTEVCDNTTGLYWEHSPIIIAFNWADAVVHCTNLGQGYVLPQVKQLISLVDYSQLNPALPAGHPFGGAVQSDAFWSATTHATNPTLAWQVNFDNGGVFNTLKDGFSRWAWCVRGAQNGS